MEQLNQGKNVFDPAKEEISALVELCINSKEREGFFCMDDFHCYAYYENSDTLKIDVSNFKMYSGYGFEIRYIKGRYYIQPYFETHNNLNDPRDDRVEMVDQNLILNKVKYKVGDSLYGKIYFHGNVMDFENSTQFGQGYFRAKVYDLGKFQDSIKAKYY